MQTQLTAVVQEKSEKVVKMYVDTGRQLYLFTQTHERMGTDPALKDHNVAINFSKHNVRHSFAPISTTYIWDNQIIVATLGVNMYRYKIR